MTQRNPWFRMEPAIQLRVNMVDDRQATIEGRSPGDNWDDQYVEFGGYYGSYGPHTFAAAPDTLEALKAALPFISLRSKQGVAAMKAAQAAIARAEGRS